MQPVAQYSGMPQTRTAAPHLLQAGVLRACPWGQAGSTHRANPCASSRRQAAPRPPPPASSLPLLPPSTNPSTHLRVGGAACPLHSRSKNASRCCVRTAGVRSNSSSTCPPPKASVSTSSPPSAAAAGAGAAGRMREEGRAGAAAAVSQLSPPLLPRAGAAGLGGCGSGTAASSQAAQAVQEVAELRCVQGVMSCTHHSSHAAQCLQGKHTHLPSCRLRRLPPPLLHPRLSAARPAAAAPQAPFGKVPALPGRPPATAGVRAGLLGKRLRGTRHDRAQRHMQKNAHLVQLQLREVRQHGGVVAGRAHTVRPTGEGAGGGASLCR